ncbi:hypothetical protein [Pseudobacteriovorax antillogorgiicola]|nr:hypothetical protein [Pseudobacteriovorax antillogorgiicola]
MLPEDFQYFRLPREQESNCSACPQIEKQGFREDYRCCTYYPRIPNFMLGLALRDKNLGPGRDRILSNIKNRFVIPEGTQASPSVWLDSVVQNSEDLFGKGRDVLCPFLIPEQRRCGIHNYRNSVCSSFYCEMSHGPVGVEFWDHLQSLILQIETALAQWILSELGVDVDEYYKIFDRWASDLPACSGRDGSWSEDIYRELWGDWLGREEEFLVASADLVLARQESLYEIASKFPIRQTKSFEKATYEAVPEVHQKERDREPYVDGIAVPIDRLWYEFQAQHKNLWVFPLGKLLAWMSDVSLEENPKDESVPSFYRKFPYRIVQGRRYQYLNNQEAEAFRLFQSPVELNSDLLGAMDRHLEDPRAKLSQWLNRGLLTTELAE